MLILEAVRLLTNQNNMLSALVWEFSQCPLEELKKIYVPTGTEELVVMSYKDDTYIPYRLTYNPNEFEEKPDYLTFKFHEDIYVFVLFNHDKKADSEETLNPTITDNSIDFITKNKLPGLVWDFDVCPLEEVKSLESSLMIENNGSCLNADRCYAVLHPKDRHDIVPVNMIDDYETISLKNNFVITICRIYRPLENTEGGLI